MKFKLVYFLIAISFFPQQSLCKISGIAIKMRSNYSNDKRIGNYSSPVISLYLPIQYQSSLQIGIDYYWKKTYWESFEQEFRGITYCGKNAQLCKSSSLNIGIIFPITNHFYTAIGGIAELIKIKRIVYNPDFPFLIYANDSVEPNLLEKKDILIIRPGISFESAINLTLAHRISVIIGASDIIIFIPHDLLMNKKWYLNLIGISCGFLLKI